MTILPNFISTFQSCFNVAPVSKFKAVNHDVIFQKMLIKMLILWLKYFYFWGTGCSNFIVFPCALKTHFRTQGKTSGGRVSDYYSKGPWFGSYMELLLNPLNYPFSKWLESLNTEWRTSFWISEYFRLFRKKLQLVMDRV